MQKTDKDTGFQAAMAAYKKIQGDDRGRAIRGLAKTYLCACREGARKTGGEGIEGIEGIGSSDLNHALATIYRRYNGNFDEAICEYVENYC